MKNTKIIIALSFIATFFISLFNFVKAVLYELDAYDFGVFFRYTYTGVAFLVTTLILIFIFLKLSENKSDEVKSDKMFVVIFAVVALGFGIGYITSHYGNNALYGKVANYESEIKNPEQAYVYHEKYLPFYDEYSDMDEKGVYEVYRSQLRDTVIVSVNSYIINQEGNMNYELEYLKTKNKLFYNKFVLQKKMFEDTVNLEGATKSAYTIGESILTVYKDGYNYVAVIDSDNEYMYLSLTNARLISEQDFVNACSEQYELSKSTADSDRLLVFDM